MALPPLPANNTTRYFVDYTTGVRNHSFVARVDEGVTAATADAQIAEVIGALRGALVNPWAVTGTRVQLAGEDFSLPTSLPETESLTGNSGAGILNAMDEPRQLTFVGRSLVTGRQVRVGFYGATFTTPGTYRLGPAGLGGIVDDVLVALFTAAFNGVFVAIDGANVLWKQYANVNFNSYWETEARG